MRKATALKTSHTMEVRKGSLSGNSFNAWDFVRNCTGDACCVSHLCDFKSKGPCRIEKDYLTAVLEPYNKLLYEEADPVLNQWVGLHLIPLYHDLIRIKMGKVLHEEVLYKSMSGKVSVNPLLGELRAQLRAIRVELTDSGIMNLLRKRGHIGGVVDRALKLSKDYDVDGEPGYYEKMSGHISDATGGVDGGVVGD